MSGLCFSTECCVTSVLVPHAVIASIRAKAPAAKGHNEHGGLLLGYRKAGALEICGATFPTRWDYGTPTSFKRSGRGHRIAALREWMRTGHTVDWIGEWHTHPGGRALPSWIDLRSWRNLVDHTKQPMTFVILGENSLYLGLQSSLSEAVEQLQPSETDSLFCLYS